MLPLLGLKQTANSANAVVPPPPPHPGVPYTVHPTQMMSFFFCQAPLPFSLTLLVRHVIAGGYSRVSWGRYWGVAARDAHSETAYSSFRGGNAHSTFAAFTTREVCNMVCGVCFMAKKRRG